MKYIVVLIIACLVGCAKPQEPTVLTGIITNVEFQSGGIQVFDNYLIEFEDGRVVQLRMRDNAVFVFCKNKNNKIVLDKHGCITSLTLLD